MSPFLRRKKARPLGPLPPEDQVRKSRAYLLWLLARRDYSRAQLEKKLSSRGLSQELRDKILDQLEEEGLFKPSAYAEARARALVRRLYSSRGIVWKLRSERLHLDADQIARLFEQEKTNEADSLKELIHKSSFHQQFETEEGHRNDKEKLLQRLLRKCETRGFSKGEVFKALQDLGLN